MVHVHVESTVKNVKFSHPNEYSDIIKAKKKSSYCSIYIGRINQSLYCQKSIENTWSAASIDETAHQVNIKAQTTVVLNMAFSLCGQIESSLFYSVHLHWYGGLH